MFMGIGLLECLLGLHIDLSCIWVCLFELFYIYIVLRFFMKECKAQQYYHVDQSKTNKNQTLLFIYSNFCFIKYLHIFCCKQSKIIKHIFHANMFFVHMKKQK